MELSKPLVSVIIPTYHRPQLVKRAAVSALSQTVKDIEVIVVIDGLDPLAVKALEELNDQRLYIIVLPINEGACSARNRGIASAKAKWIAHLDDDDEWLPQKLEKQLSVAAASAYRYPIVTSRVVAKTPEGEFIYPRRFPSPSEPLSEYLFVRNNLFQGEGLIHTSSIMTLKELLLKVQYGDSNLPKLFPHDDWDWVLKASSLEGVGIEFMSEALSIWDLKTNASSVSRNTQWKVSLDWIRSKRGSMSPRAYSSFLLAEVSSYAANQQVWLAFFSLLFEAVRFGKPKFKDVFLHFGMWIFPPQVRKIFRQLLIKKFQPIDG